MAKECYLVAIKGKHKAKATFTVSLNVVVE